MKNKVVSSRNSNGDKIACLITDFETNEYTKGFKLSFRLYNVSEGIGGFETTLFISNCDKSLAKMFCGLKANYRYAELLTGSKITSFKTDNKVPAKFRFEKVGEKLKSGDQ